MKSAPAPTQQRHLWRHLWIWTLCTLTAIWLILAAVAYYTGLHEADEITGGQLISTARLLLRPEAQLGLAGPGSSAGQTPLSSKPYAIHDVPELRLVLWEQGELLWDTHGIAAQLPPALSPGHHTLFFGPPEATRAWRAYVADGPVQNGATRRVAVMIDMGRRQAMGRDIAEHIVRPALILLPLVALLLAWAIRRGIAPLERLSEQIAALDLDAGQTVPARQPFQELSGTAHAINTLARRLQSQLERERRFTSDVAHELRTPLTSMLLHSRLARATGQDAEREAALGTVEHDALRAGRILGQLLDLARAQKLDGQSTEPVDLCALARQVVAAHAPMAYELGQELALEAPPEPVRVQGHATMLELALRNLVDNALRHTPRGTLVEVQVGHGTGGGGFLSVRDNGARAGVQPGPGASTGLGVGLALVQRIADTHGAALEQVQGTPSRPHRFTLAWPPN